MRIKGICFTPGGEKTLGRILHMGWAKEDEFSAYVLSGHRKQKLTAEHGQTGPDGVLEDPAIQAWQGRLADWMAAMMDQADAFVFVGAAGIAIRAMAPYIKSKATDPALVVLDEKGHFVIPLLSGHLGGANALAKRIGLGLDAQVVFTTATDVRGLFAVDVFAKENGLWISDLKAAKEVSAALLRGEAVGFMTDLPLEGDLPKELTGLQMAGQACGPASESGIEPDIETDIETGIVVSARIPAAPFFSRQLWLVPKNLVLGIGCRRGTQKDQILSAVEAMLAREGLSARALAAIASIDLKKDEEGLRQAADHLGLPFLTFPARDLNRLKGQFSESDFVQAVTGVSNVCERSAVLGAGGGRLLVPKQAGNGLTLAVAQKEILLRTGKEDG